MINDKDKIIDYINKNNVENSKELLLLLEGDNCYSRSNAFGHITSSAFILSKEEDKVLLILHKKYNKYIAPGGHVDDGENSLLACRREALEEVGIDDLSLLKEDIFDIDIHRIPEANKNGILEPEHWHFDIRYLFKANTNEVSINLEEANGFQWIDIRDLESINDISTKRMAKKAQDFIKNGKQLKSKKMKF